MKAGTNKVFLTQKAQEAFLQHLIRAAHVQEDHSRQKKVNVVLSRPPARPKKKEKPCVGVEPTAV